MNVNLLVIIILIVTVAGSLMSKYLISKHHSQEAVKKDDLVRVSVYTPTSIAPGSKFILTVWAYLKKQKKAERRSQLFLFRSLTPMQNPLPDFLSISWRPPFLLLQRTSRAPLKEPEQILDTRGILTSDLQNRQGEPL